MGDKQEGPETYITTVPDHHDRVIWRGRYYGLPIPSHAEALSRLAEAEAEVEQLRQALQDVVNPIGRLQRGMPDGYALDDRAAAELAKDPTYLRAIANDALLAALKEKGK